MIIYLGVVKTLQNNVNFALQDFQLEIFYSDLIKLADDTAPLSATNICDLADTVVMRTSVKRSNGKFLFDIGGTVIGVSTYNLVSKQGKPMRQKLARDTNEPVSSKRSWIHPINGAKLLPSDMQRSLIYGGKKIKFSEDEYKALNSIEQNVHPLKLCGFKPISTLKHSKFIRSSHFIYPHEMTVEGSKTVFSALLKSCSKKQVMAVCKVILKGFQIHYHSTFP